MMNKKIFIAVLSGFLAGFLTCYASRQKVEAADSAATASALVASTAGIVDLYFESSRNLDLDTKNILLKTIRNQSLILVSLNLDPSEMDAAGFSGICRLVSSSSLLFSLSGNGSVAAISDQFLRSRFENQREAISNESVKRRQRKGDSHSCPGFN